MLFIFGFWITTFGIATLMMPYESNKFISITELLAIRSAITTIGVYLLALHFNLAS